MHRELVTEIEIDASADEVWRILADFEKYPQWNPFIKRAEGSLQEGERLEVSLQPPGKKAMTIRPRLVSVVPGRELVWFGRLFVPRLFDGKHFFQIEPLEHDRVRFVQKEEFRGILVPLLGKMLDTNVRRGFDAMNLELKNRAESGS